MIRVPADIQPQHELAIRRAWDRLSAGILDADGPASALKLAAVIFELRHHLRPRLSAETVDHLAAAAGISPITASRSLKWLREAGFVWHGRGAGRRITSAVMIERVYLAALSDVFHRDIPNLSTTEADPIKHGGVRHYKAPPRRSFGTTRRTVGFIATRPGSARDSIWRVPTANDTRKAAMGVLGKLAPPGFS